MPTTYYEEYRFCSYCDKEVEGRWEGMPISGTYLVCEFCGRNEADLFADNKGLEHRQRNPKNIYSEEEVHKMESTLNEWWQEELEQLKKGLKESYHNLCTTSDFIQMEKLFIKYVEDYHDIKIPEEFIYHCIIKELDDKFKEVNK